MLSESELPDTLAQAWADFQMIWEYDDGDAVDLARSTDGFFAVLKASFYAGAWYMHYRTDRYYGATQEEIRKDVEGLDSELQEFFQGAIRIAEDRMKPRRGEPIN